MTKREICERLINIHNRLFHEYAMADGMEDIDVEEIGKDIGSLILDLAAPETEEHFADAGKMMEKAREEYKREATLKALNLETSAKEPPVLIYEEKGEKVPCPVCGAPAAPIKNKPGLFRCKRCQGLVCAQEGNAPSRGIKEQFLALGEKAIKKIDFDKVADAEWEICSGSYERMLSWARGAIEGAVSKVVAGVTGGEEAEFAFGCLDAKASRKNGRLRIELNHRRTKQYVEVEEMES